MSACGSTTSSLSWTNSPTLRARDTNQLATSAGAFVASAVSRIFMTIAGKGTPARAFSILIGTPDASRMAERESVVWMKSRRSAEEV